jgi:hypothetical protein
VFLKELVRHITGEEVYKFSKVWIANIARRQIWLASSISRVSSSAEPSIGLLLVLVSSSSAQTQ